VIVGAPYNSGILARGAVEGATYFDGPPPPAVRDKVGRMERACAAHGVSLAAAALRFPLGHPVVASVLPGVRSADGVRRTLDLFDETIPDDLWLQLKSEGLIHAEAPIPPN
jgi:D-threo-aldose 1-dehydrogenase